jgi:hypothetical protein
MADTPTPSRGSRRRVIPWWKQRPGQVAIAVVVVLAVVLAVALATRGGSGGDGEASTSTAGETTTTTAPPIAPLTGLPGFPGVDLARPAMSVKIDNVPLSQRPPQAGLDVADVVYEEPVEGATRFLAVFHSQASDRVGPVRSTRFIDPGIVWPIGGLYVFSGGTADKVAAIRDSPVQTLDETALAGIDGRVRDPDVNAPHNLFAIPDRVWPAATVAGPPAPLFEYRAEGVELDGEAVASVELPTLSRARYTWDAAAAAWRREEVLSSGSGPEPHLAESGAQIAPTNVIVQRIPGTGDKSALVGEGDAWVFADGKMVRGRWIRGTLEERTRFVDAAGAEIALTPGPTWVHFVLEGEPAVTAATPTSAP